MLKVFLIAVLFNTSTGEIVGGITAKFPSVEACEASIKELPVAPFGHSVYVKCVNPSDVST